MSLCAGGITGINTLDCSDIPTSGECVVDTRPWGYNCCVWIGGAEQYCAAKGCPNLDNPDECPGCDECHGAVGGWLINDNRGDLNQTVFVENNVVCVAPGHLDIRTGKLLYCADAWRSNINVYDGGGINVYNPGSVPHF